MITYRPGYFCDVCELQPGRIAHVYESGLSVVCEVEGAPLWTTLTQESLMFTRCAVHAGEVYSIHQEHDSGHALLVTAGIVRDLGLTFGVQPVAIDADYAYIVRSAFSYDAIELATGIVTSFASPVPGSSQGISDVLPDGSLWWADAHRTMSKPGLPTLTYPNQRGLVTVGQSDPAQIAGWLGAEPFTAILGEGYEPHLVQSGDRCAICARTPRGAALVIVPPYPPFVFPVPIPLPAPTPVPVPSPPKEPTVPAAPNALSTVRAVIAAHPEINTLADGPFAPNRGGITQLVVQALGGFPWGRKSRDRSPTNLSDDALCYRLQDNRFEIYDILNGGDGSATFEYAGTFADGENGYFSTVATTPGPTPTPVPTPAPVDLSGVLAQLSALTGRVTALEAVKPGTQRIALKTSDGHYVCAEGGGGGVVNATRTAAGAWETFTAEPQ